MGTKVQFLQTTSSNLNSIPVKAGQAIFCTDTNTVYQDTIGGSCKVFYK